MKEFLLLVGWWLVFSLLWALVKFFQPSENLTELLLKPVIWLGLIWLFLRLKLIPQSVLSELKQSFLRLRPFWQIFVLPIVFTGAYFSLINFRFLGDHPVFSIGLATWVLVLNFATATVEEITYRGFLYLWLRRMTNEGLAFGLVQLFFLLGHLPTLFLNSPSLSSAITHAFFIVLLSTIQTAFFRFNKSLYSSIISHGIWNSLAQYFLVL